MGIINTLSFITRHPLNKRRKLQSVRRWVAWQLGSRLVPGPIAVNFVNNTRLLVAPGMTGATGNVYTGLHEFQDMAFALHLLRRGDVFVDVGANVGSYTVLAGGLGAKCISIEPIKTAFDHLLLNISLNGLHGAVDARNMGAGACKGVLKFTKGLDTVNHVATDCDARNAECTSVEVDMLDNIVAGLQPVLVKIDVEGFESEVISGAANMLCEESLLAVIVELNGSGHRYGVNDSDTHKRMLAYGFKPCAYSPFSRELEVVPVISAGPSANIIYVKHVEAAAHRLKSAARFHVNGNDI
jgi:FkbM family methyltransferase